MSVDTSAYDSWLSLIKDLQLPFELKETLVKTRLKKVEVSPSGETWRMVIETPVAIPESVVTTVEKSIANYTATNPEVVLRMETIKMAQPVRPSLAELWSQSIATVTTRLPFLEPWLQTASWSFDNNTLTIILGNEFTAHLFKTRRADMLIQQLWAKYNYGDIAVVVDWDKDLAADIEAELKATKEDELRHYLEEIEDQPKSNLQPDQTALGSSISGTYQPISALGEEDLGSKVVIEGYVTKWEIRKTKKGKRLFLFDLADETDAISVKTLLRKPEEEEAIAKVGSGTWLRVKGELTFDRFAGEEIVWADTMEIIVPKQRKDEADQKRVELHLHTQMSSLDATTRLKDLFELAAAWGHEAVAITDHGSVQAFPEAYELGRRYGIKVLYGVEGYLVDDEQDPLYDKAPVYHIIILVKNQTGLKNLYRLITVAHLNYFHRVPRIPRSELKEYREGLILGSACEAGEVFRAILHNFPEQEVRRLASFYDFLEIQPRENNAFLVRRGEKTEEQLLELNRYLVRLGAELNRPVVATGDVHFLNPEDEVLRRILLTGQNYSDANFQPPLYLKTTDEMLKEFDYLGEETAYRVVVESPAKLAASIEDVQPMPIGLATPQINGAADQIEQMARRQAQELYGTPLPDIVASRLDKELNSIISNGYADIYLIAHQLVKKSLEDGYLVGSRGSVGSSLVATLCQITEVNPLPPHYRCPKCCYSQFVNPGQGSSSGYDLPDKHCPHCVTILIKEGQDIPFETFLGFKGDKVPDIDLNFSGEYQAQIHRYTEELFGRDHVFRAGTISTIAERTAYGFVRAYADSNGLKLRKAQAERLAMGLCGTRRTTGQHPGGLMIVPSNRNILDFTPVQHPADAKNSDVRTTHFDYHSISDRLLKLDLLGHDDPTVLKMLEEMTGVNPRFVPLDDADTMKLFSEVTPLGVTANDIGSEVGTLGLPEFGTRFVRQMLIETRPQTFSELVRISGLSHGTDVWLNNAQELIRTGQANLSQVICTRDDIMLFLIEQGLDPAWSFKIMEDVRKGRGLTSEMETMMREKCVPEWYIDSCRKIKYMFPKAHAAAYVLMAVRIAYFKVHYPAAFYASYFTARADDFSLEIVSKGPEEVIKQIHAVETKGNEASAREKSLLTILEVVREMFARGLNFAPLDITNSHPTRFQITDQGLLPPLISVPGLGRTAAENIVLARRERPFSSQEDLRIRGRLSKTLLSLLQDAGCLDHLPATDQLDLFSVLPTG
jgi:DNA polymerase-3 subunit alpha (Gram-positive type)